MKRLFSPIIATALLAVTAGTAFAGSALELVQVANNGGGPTFTFRVIGDFSDDELAGGFVQVQGGDDFPLYCAQTAPDTVVCHTSKKTGGHNVVVGFGGARFWTDVPEPGPGRMFCYSAWDWWDFTGFQWTDFGPICQDEPAQLFDEGYYDLNGVPQWVVFYDIDVSGNCSPDPVPYDGPAYYFPACPP